MSIQCERVSHEHLQLQSECRHSLNRAEEIEQLRKVIVERGEEISKIEEEISAIHDRFASQEKAVNEVRLSKDCINFHSSIFLESS